MSTSTTYNYTPPTSLTCPLCSQLMSLPVTMLCCGVTTCEQCGLDLGRRGKPCICGVVVSGREDMLYNEDVKLELERYNQNIKRKRSGSRESSHGQSASKKEKSDKKCKFSSVNDNSEEYAEEPRDFDDKKIQDFKTDYNGNEVCENEKKVDKTEQTSIDDEDQVNNVDDKDTSAIHKSNCEDDKVESTEYFENHLENIISSTKKFNNVLVFIDLLKMNNSSESPLSQIGCYFDESSLKNQNLENEDLQFQAFYAVTAPRLQEYNERADLWPKYFLFDEFYYKHPGQTIRCSTEIVVIERFCQYLAKLKLKYREVNICVAKNKHIKELMKRINHNKFGHVFFPNVDGYVVVEDLERIDSVEDFLKKHMKLSFIPEHSDVRSKLLYFAAFELLSENFWDIHKFPLNLKGSSENNNHEALAGKSKSLYIGDLSTQVTDKDLERKLCQVAKPFSVKVCLHPKTGTSLGYAYANFHSEAKAEKILMKLQGSPLLNKPMRIMYYNKKVVARKSHLWMSNVFVKNLDSEVDSKRLHSAFCAYGAILSCKVETNEFGKSKCYGFVQFRTDISAWKAINDLHGLTVNGKELYVTIKKSIRDRIDEEEEIYSGKSLEVSNLSYETTNESFLALFKEFVGNITCFALDVTRAGDMVGLVTFKSSRFASQAMYSLEEKKVDGLKLVVMKQKLTSIGRLQDLIMKEKKQRELEKDKMEYRKTGFNDMKTKEKNLKDGRDIYQKRVSKGTKTKMRKIRRIDEYDREYRTNQLERFEDKGKSKGGYGQIRARFEEERENWTQKYEERKRM
eukprot:GFUD01023010.1.p1 GENE.GFUD01023010.1~~GFUD01023010.1.p1  ORF type:complete len:796 (-),score=201.98 GFUD01023010.1:140-2527(-)